MHIFAVVNVSQTYIFVHIQQYRVETYPLECVCYRPNHFEELIKLLEREMSRVHKRLKVFRLNYKNRITKYIVLEILIKM